MRADYSQHPTDVLLHMVRTASRARKAGPFAEIVSRTAFMVPVLERLLMCATPYRDVIPGSLRQGLWRCGETSCSRCAERLGKTEGIRSWSLVKAVLGEKPDRQHISFVTLNSAERDESAFKAQITRFMRKHGLKGAGAYSVSLNGRLHVHFVCLHPKRSRLRLERMFKEEFGEYPMAQVKWLNLSQSLEQAVRNVVQYAHMPVKGRDFRHQEHLLNADRLAMFVVWDSSVSRKRRLECGWTRQEKEAAEGIRQGMKVHRKAKKQKPTSILLASIRNAKPRNRNVISGLAREQAATEFGKKDVKGMYELNSTPGSSALRSGVPLFPWAS